MKWIRTVVVFDKGRLIDSKDWTEIHQGYTAAIGKLVHPPGAKDFTIRKKTKKIKNGKPTKQWWRNGVSPIKDQFLARLQEDDWIPEEPVSLREYFESLKKEDEDVQAILKTFPDKSDFKETLHSSLGDFDFFMKTPSGFRTVIEWETGNISSSHRSLNKLCLCLMAAQIDVGVLIVPSRDMYEHLTDRVGNWNELAPYLPYWNRVGLGLVTKGLLAVTVVEHDHLTVDPSVDYLSTKDDGNAARGAASIKQLTKKRRAKPKRRSS
jgi:hypothetical protein